MLEMLEKKLIKVKKLSKISWSISIAKIVFFILAIALEAAAVTTTVTNAINYSNSLNNNYQDPLSEILTTTNLAMWGVGIFFWAMFAFSCVTTVIINIITAVTCSNSGIIVQSTKEMQIKENLQTSMVMAIIGIFFVSMILNIIICVRTSNIIKQLKEI